MSTAIMRTPSPTRAFFASVFGSLSILGFVALVVLILNFAMFRLSEEGNDSFADQTQFSAGAMSAKYP